MGLATAFLQKFGITGAVLFVDKNGTPFGTTNSNNAIATCPEEHHTSFSEEYTGDGSGNVDATAIITPTSGKKIGVHLFTMNTDTATGVPSLDFVTSGKKVGRLYASKTGQAEAAQDHTEGAIDEVLTFTATGIGSGKKVFVKV